MKMKLINKKTIKYEYWDKPAEWDEYEYFCPCGNGKIVETYDETPGNREHLVNIICKTCSKEYKIGKSIGVHNWELVKIKKDNWETFLEKLDLENEFDSDLKNYLNAIKYISEITVKDIDLFEIRKIINEQLNYIVNFIKKYSDTHYEIGLIKGFKVNEKEYNGNWKINGRDYYYYIADQKMKASVYYVRYLNYINKHLEESDSVEKEMERYISNIQSKIRTNIKISIDNIIGIFDDYLEQTDENNQMRQKCIECIEQIKAKDMNYLKYMLFNNMMREIRYIGAAYQYLWHWEMKTKNLFRCASYNSSKISIENNYSKKSFLQQMFNDVISHMNKSSEKLCSYSEDPYVDVFKYLKIQKSNIYNKEFIDICNTSDGINIKIESLENKNKARFDIIKGANINSIHIDGLSKSFYDFVQDEKNLENYDSIAYAVELYQDLRKGEKNSKNTTKNIKDLLLSYLLTWYDGQEVAKLMSYVADDKEVVTHGKIEKYTEIVDDNNIPKNFQDGTMYKIELDKNDLIYLILKIRENINIDNIIKRYNVNLNIDYNLENWIKSVIKEETQNNHTINGKISQLIKFTNNKNILIDIDIKCEISPSFVYKIDKPTLESCKKRISESIEDNIKKYFYTRYIDILEENLSTVIFILKFINEEGYKCPSYINEYNEYKINEGDTEIAILKYLIFKRSDNEK